MNRIDLTHPDAPELAGYGPYPIGVQTLALANPGQIDVLGSVEAVRRYDRPVTVELWYPAVLGTPPDTTYATLLRDGHRAITLHGRAYRDAAQAAGEC